MLSVNQIFRNNFKYVAWVVLALLFAAPSFAASDVAASEPQNELETLLPTDPKQDHDGDGIINLYDEDDDNDGIPDDVECSVSPEGDLLSIINGSFEEPVIGETADLQSQRWGQFPTVAVTYYDKDVPGWSTTASDRRIEMWVSGFGGVPSYDGNQHAEINANMYAGLYMDIETTPGDNMEWGFAHRGRAGTDTIALYIGPADGTLTKIGEYSSSRYGWNVFDGNYVVPAGQTQTRFEYRAVHAAGSLSIGNFLDGIYFKTTACTLDTDGDGLVNSLDLDSDGDTRLDIIEGGGTDTDNDGKIDSFTDGNGDGAHDPLAADPLPLPNTDGDAWPDFLDPDSNNDGVTDLVESYGTPSPASFNPMSCDGTIYQVANDKIYTIDASDSSVGLSSVFLQHNQRMNALGHNPKDNYMYALDAQGNVLQIGEGGAFRSLGKIPGASKMFPVGSFLSDGTYIVGGSGGPFYHINLAEMEVIKTVTPTTQVRFQDFSVSPLNGQVYSKDSSNGQLLSIDMNTGDVTHYGYAYGGNSGALWFDSAGNLYAYSLSHSKYFRMNPETLETIEVGTGPKLTSIDATACAYGLEVYLDIDDVGVYQADLELKLSTVNSSSSVLTDVTYEQTLPEGFAFRSSDMPAIEAAFRSGYGEGASVSIDGRTITVSGLVIPHGETLISFPVMQDGNNEIEVDFQGTMKNLPSILGSEMPTDDPTTGPTPDPTTVYFSVPQVPTVTCSSDPSVFNTGYDRNGGQLTGGWTDLGWQAGLGGPNGPDGVAFTPALVIKNKIGAWASSPFGNANWIHYSGHPSGRHSGEIDVYYRFEFDMDALVDPDAFFLKIDYFADNNVYEVYINGVAQSQYTNALPVFGEAYEAVAYRTGQQASMTLNESWQTGRNEVIVQIRSRQSHEGFMAQVTSEALCFSEPPVVACPAGYDLVDYVIGDAFGSTPVNWSGEMPFDGTLLLQGWVREGHPEQNCSIFGLSSESAICQQYQDSENLQIDLTQYKATTTIGTYSDNQGALGYQNYYFADGPHATIVEEGAFSLDFIHPGPRRTHSVSFNYAICAGDPLPMRDISIDVNVPTHVQPGQTFGNEVSPWTYTVQNLSETELSENVVFVDEFTDGLDLSGFDIVSSQPNDWDCSVEENLLTCTALNPLPAGYTATFSAAGAEIPTDFEPNTVNHDVLISSNPSDRTNRLDNNSAAVSSSVIRADASIQLTASVDSTSLEQTVGYTVTVSNNSNIPEWKNDAVNPEVVVDLPSVDVVDFLDTEFTVHSGWSCQLINDDSQLACEKIGEDEITHGTVDEPVVSFSLTPRGDYLDDSMVVVASLTTDTFDPKEINNTSSSAVSLVREWQMLPGYEKQINAFAHLRFDEDFVENPSGKSYNLERDQALNEWVVTPLQVPIQTAFGISLTTKPTMTVVHCLDNDVAHECIDDRAVITGTALVSSFTIDTFVQLDDELNPIEDFSPESAIVVPLGIDSSDGRYVSEDSADCRSEASDGVFEVNVDCLVPHDEAVSIAENEIVGLYENTFEWQSHEYVTLALKTKGGRDIELPAGTNASIIINDALPGNYRIEGAMSIRLKYEDSRLSSAEPVYIDVTYPVVLYFEVFAPFSEGNE